MKKLSYPKVFYIIALMLFYFQTHAMKHTILVWDGYYKFLPQNISIQLGDTVQWLPLDSPTMVHTITSTNIPSGGASFNYIYQAPSDTFFQYVPQVAGVYDYECTPHIAWGMIGTITVNTGSVGIISTNQIENDFNLFPNPFNEVLNINSNAKMIGKRYIVVNNLGQEVLNGEILSVFTTLNLACLSEGVYSIFIDDSRKRLHLILKK